MIKIILDSTADLERRVTVRAGFLQGCRDDILETHRKRTWRHLPTIAERLNAELSRAFHGTSRNGEHIHPDSWGQTWRELWCHFYNDEPDDDAVATFKMNVSNGYNTFQGTERLNGDSDDEFIGVVMAFYKISLPSE